VVDNNPDYDYGDQISFYDVLQKVNAETQIPYCNFSASYVVLDKDSTVKLWDLVNKAGFASVGGYLGHGADEGDGVFAWVHSRYDNGKTKVSTQFLIANNSYLADYKDDEAYTLACKSYGGSNSTFLTPENDGTGAGSSSGSPSAGSGTGTTKYTLSLAASPTAGGSVSGSGQYNAGQSVQISATANSGYTFSRWSDGVTSASRSVVMNENKTLSAIFTSTGGTTPDPTEGDGEENNLH